MTYAFTGDFKQSGNLAIQALDHTPHRGTRMTGIALRRMVKSGFAALALLALAAFPALAQNAVIRGTVTSADRNEPITGVNVLIAELNISVLTSDRGQYVITVPAARI